MIRVLIPPGNIMERAYAIHVLMYEFLGLEYQLNVDRTLTSYVIVTDGGRVEIADALFGHGSPYLLQGNIPEIAAMAETPGLQGVQVIYGSDQYSHNDNGIYCGVDLFASAFFMLTRWEELLSADRDRHGRFPYTSSLSHRSSSINRPVVNEYARLLGDFLEAVGLPGKLIMRGQFRRILTADIDHPWEWDTQGRALRKIAGTAVRTGSIASTWRKADSFRRFVRDGKDPYDTFDLMMDLAESTEEKACFFFMTGGDHELDPGLTLDHPRLLAIMRRIQRRGHITGLHPSYNTVDHPDQFKSEASQFRKHSGQSRFAGRQHYLRGDAPFYWRLWERYGGTWESTCGYAEMAGFKSGACRPYPLFDVLKRRMIAVYERPLIAMDVTLKNYMNLDPTAAWNTCRQLMDQTRRHDGEFLVLWHNSSLDEDEWEGYENVLSQIMTSE